MRPTTLSGVSYSPHGTKLGRSAARAGRKDRKGGCRETTRRSATTRCPRFEDPLAGKGESPMLKVHGHPFSTCTRKVLMTLAETETPYEFSVVDFAKGEHKQAPHLEKQPFGRIPVLEDGAFSFFESRAICRYLDEKAG